MIKQNNALRLAELLTADEWPGHMTLVSYARECVAELRRQHTELEILRAGYDAARLEIESLRGQLRGWVSLPGELPKSGMVVLACYRNSLGNLRRIRAQWIAAKTDECTGDDGCLGEYAADTDTYWTPEGWYELIDNWDDYMACAVSQGDVTHWMPLPAGPAEGETK